MPESRAGTKARNETSTYDDDSYEEADTKDGSSTRPSAVPKEAHPVWQVQAPGAGQHAEKMWAQMQNSPRLLETIDATRHGRPQYSGTLWSRKSSTDEESEDADESAAIDRTERALLAELQRVAERRRSLRASLGVSQPTEMAIADEEPETTVEEIMQRGKTRERLAAERAQAEATHVEGERLETFAQQRAAEAEARERHTAQELERMRLTLASMHHKESTSRDAVLVALMETMKQLKPEPREPKVYTPKDIRDGIVPPCPMDKNATEMREWATTLAGAASGLSAKASELVGMTLRAEPYTLSKSHSTDEYVDANRWLARQVLASIKPETDAARVFLKEVRSDINLIESGVSLIAKLLKQVASTDSLKMESAETRFQTTVYFRGGMTHDQVRLAVAAFKADYTARPFFDNRKYAMLAAMLKELPPSIKEPFVRDELRSEERRVGKD